MNRRKQNWTYKTPIQIRLGTFVIDFTYEEMIELLAAGIYELKINPARPDIATMKIKAKLAMDELPSSDY